MAEPPLNPAIQKPPGFRYPGHPVAIPIKLPPGKHGHRHHLPRFHHEKQRRHGRGCLCYCCCIFWIIIFVIIFATVVAAALFYFIYEPKPPALRLESFRVPNLNITKKPDGAYLDVDTVLRVEVKNPNGKMRFNFGTTSVGISVDDGEVCLGSATVPGFTVKEKAETSLKAETSVRGEALDDRQGRNLKGRFERKEVVPKADFRTKIGVNMQGWKMGSMKINLVCGGVSWEDLDNGFAPKCTITLLNW